MKQGQLSNFFKKLTLVPESSNGDERVQPGATVETRASPPKQKQPAARPKILVHSRPSVRHKRLAQARPVAKGLFKNHITHLEGRGAAGVRKELSI